MSRVSTEFFASDERFSSSLGDESAISDDMMDMFTNGNFDNVGETQTDYSSLLTTMDLSGMESRYDDTGDHSAAQEGVDGNSSDWEASGQSLGIHISRGANSIQPQDAPQPLHYIPGPRLQHNSTNLALDAQHESPVMGHSPTGPHGKSPFNSESSANLASPHDHDGHFSPSSNSDDHEHELKQRPSISRLNLNDERVKMAPMTHKITKKASRQSLRSRKSRVGFDDEPGVRSPIMRNDSFSSESTAGILSPRASSASLFDSNAAAAHFNKMQHNRAGFRTLQASRLETRSHADIRSAAKFQSMTNLNGGPGMTDFHGNEVADTFVIKEENIGQTTHPADQTPMRRLQKASSTSQLKTPTVLMTHPATPGLKGNSQATPSTIVASSATIKQRYKRNSNSNGSASPTPATRATSSTSTTLVAEANDSSPAKGVFSNRKPAPAPSSQKKKSSSIIPEMSSAMSQFQVDLNITPSVASARAALNSAQASMANIDTNPLNIPTTDMSRAPQFVRPLPSSQQHQQQQQQPQQQQPQLQGQQHMLPPQPLRPASNGRGELVLPPRTSSRGVSQKPAGLQSQPPKYDRYGYNRPMDNAHLPPAARQMTPDSRMIEIAPSGEMLGFANDPRGRQQNLRWQSKNSLQEPHARPPQSHGSIYQRPALQFHHGQVPQTNIDQPQGRPPALNLDQFAHNPRLNRQESVRHEPMSAPAGPTHMGPHDAYLGYNRNDTSPRAPMAPAGRPGSQSMAAAAAAAASRGHQRERVNSGPVQIITPPLTSSVHSDGVTLSPEVPVDENIWSNARPPQRFSSNDSFAYQPDFSEAKDSFSQTSQLDLDAPPFEWSEGLGADDSWDMMGYLKTDYK